MATWLSTLRARALPVPLGLTTLVVAGIGVRLLYFVPDTSLWGDEALLVTELQGRGLGDLIRPLGRTQQAPVLFLLAEKLLLSRVGLEEHWLRLPAFLGSIAALVLFAWLAHRVLPQVAALLATALFAVCPMLIRYSAEVKPYGVDAAVTSVLLCLTVPAIQSDWSRRWLVVLGVAGSAVIWLSYPAPFVLAGIGIAAIADRVRAKRFDQALACVAVATVWLVSFGAMYWLMAADVAANPRLQAFWEPAFARLPPHSIWDVRASVALLMKMIENPMGLAGPGLGVLLIACGAWALAVRDWRWTVMALVPIAAAFLASSQELYPFASRLLLFAMPLLTLLVAAGAAHISTRLGQPWLTAVMAACLLTAPVVGARDLLAAPERSGVRDLLKEITRRAKPGDTVYLNRYSQASFRLYASALDRSDVSVVRGLPDDAGDGRFIFEGLRQLDGHHRVWLLFTETQLETRSYGERAFLSAADLMGRRLDEISFGPGRAYLYESPTGRWLVN